MTFDEADTLPVRGQRQGRILQTSLELRVQGPGISLVAPLLRWVQRHQIRAYDEVRSSVADTLTEISESVMGAPVIRAYGVQWRARARLHRAIARQYRAQMRAAWYFALMFPVADVFGAVALGSVIGVGAWWGPGWGLDQGALVACVFLTSLILQPIGEIGEVRSDMGLQNLLHRVRFEAELRRHQCRDPCGPVRPRIALLSRQSENKRRRPRAVDDLALHALQTQTPFLSLQHLVGGLRLKEGGPAGSRRRQPILP